jgi:hypothetical protein
VIRPAPVALAAILLWAACAEVQENQGWRYDGPVNECESDADCPAGACAVDLGRCAVSPPAGGETLYVEVFPPGEAEVPSQVFEVALGADGVVEAPLEVRRPVVVQGETRAGEENLEALVVFTDRGDRLPGKSARRTVYDSSEGVFNLELLPGLYDLLALPEGEQAEQYPPYYLDDVELTVQGELRRDAGPPLGLVVPEPETEVSGAIRIGGVPVNGLSVQAGSPDGARRLSTPATTACRGEESERVCGAFTIELASGAEQFSLLVSRQGQPHHPQITIDGFVVEEPGEALDLSGDPRLSLDPLGPPLRYHATVERPIMADDGQLLQDPAPRCFVRFSSGSVAGGRVERWVETNEAGALEQSDGVLGVMLYPGEYEVIAIPAEALSDSLTDYTPFVSGDPVVISGSGEIGGQVFPLSWRPLYKGWVLADGREVPSTSLVAEPLTDSATVRSNAAGTGFDGEYAIWLDPGEYQLTAEAPPESGYAWATTELEVEGNGSLDLELPLPYIASARVVASGDQVDPIELGGSLVVWYRVVDGVARAIARGAAGEDGELVALLPPPG